MIKPIAFYLPQFHCIPENDEWWGKGFTEWTNVKKSKSLFKNHMQPEIPLDENYYNLLDKNVMVEQSRMARNHGIYGFCYYHYWFNGKLLLEKPLENMLDNKDVDMPFCICWANESWARTWDGQESNVLISQNYEENDIELSSHFDYILNFFKDSRYIKIDNKPMFIIYKPYLIKNINQMIKVWNGLAKKNGFDGIYFGYQFPDSFDYDNVIKKFDFGIEFEPLYTRKEFSQKLSKMNIFDKFIFTFEKKPKWLKYKLYKKIMSKFPNRYDYDEIWNDILSRTPINENICPGAFPSWDNTPRKGSNGTVFFEATPEKFSKYLKKQVERAEKLYNSEFIFINAWNEWGEGAHLEPDEYNKYGYLEAVKNSLKYK